MQSLKPFLILLVSTTLFLKPGLQSQIPVAQSSASEVEVEVDLGAIEPIVEFEAETPEVTVEEPIPVESAPVVETPAVEEGVVFEDLQAAEEASVGSMAEVDPEIEAGPGEALELIEPSPSENIPLDESAVQGAPAPESIADEIAVTAADADSMTTGTEEGAAAVESDPELSESIRFLSNDLGERLIVRYEIAKEGDPTRSLQLRLFDDMQYDPETYSFVPAEVFEISGQGLTVSGLTFKVDELDRRQAMIDLLRKFEEDARRFSNRRDEIVGRDKDWMSEGVSALNGSVPYGTIETDFFRGPVDLTFNWDFRADRIWLSMNGLVSIDSNLAFPIRNFLGNIDRYVALRKEYAAEIAAVQDTIASLLTE